MKQTAKLLFRLRNFLQKIRDDNLTDVFTRVTKATEKMCILTDFKDLRRKKNKATNSV